MHYIFCSCGSWVGILLREAVEKDNRKLEELAF